MGDPNDINSIPLGPEIHEVDFDRIYAEGKKLWRNWYKVNRLMQYQPMGTNMAVTNLCVSS